MQSFCNELLHLGEEISQLYSNAQYYQSIGELEGAIVSYSSAASMIHVLLKTDALKKYHVKKRSANFDESDKSPKLTRFHSLPPAPKADIKPKIIVPKDDIKPEPIIPKDDTKPEPIILEPDKELGPDSSSYLCSNKLYNILDESISGEASSIIDTLNRILLVCLGQIESLQKKIRDRNIKNNNNEDDEEDLSCSNIRNLVFEKGDCLTFIDVIGLHNEKKILRTSFLNPLTYPNIYPKLGNGILFYGFPGTGKTFIAKAAVNQLQMENKNISVLFFTPTGAELKGKFVGETEKNIKKIFSCASKKADECEANQTDNNKKKYISIIFIDEFDSIAGSRDDDPSGLKANAVNTLLQMMDGISSYSNVSVIAVTNYPWKLDTAILRRFDRQILFSLSDSNSILEQIKLEYSKNIGFRKVKPIQKKKKKEDKNTCNSKCEQTPDDARGKIDSNLFILDLFDQSNTQRMKNICDFYEQDHYSSSDISKVVNQAITNSGNDAIENGLFYKLPTNKLPDTLSNKTHNALVDKVNEFFNNSKITSEINKQNNSKLLKNDTDSAVESAVESSVESAVGNYNDIYMSTLTMLKGTSGKLYMSQLIHSYYSNLLKQMSGEQTSNNNSLIININNENINGKIEYNGKTYYNTKILPFICKDIPVNINKIRNVYVEVDIDNLRNNFMNYDEIVSSLEKHNNVRDTVNIDISSSYQSISREINFDHNLFVPVTFNINPKINLVDVKVENSSYINVIKPSCPINYNDTGGSCEIKYKIIKPANESDKNSKIDYGKDYTKTFTVIRNKDKFEIKCSGDKNTIVVNGQGIKANPICMYTYDEWIKYSPTRKISMILESDDISIKNNNKFKDYNIPIFNNIYEKVHNFSTKSSNELFTELKTIIGQTTEFGGKIVATHDTISFYSILYKKNDYGYGEMILLDKEFSEKIPFGSMRIVSKDTQTTTRFYIGDQVSVINTNKLRTLEWWKPTNNTYHIEGFYANNNNGKVLYYAKLKLSVITSLATGNIFVNVFNLKPINKDYFNQIYSPDDQGLTDMNQKCNNDITISNTDMDIISRSKQDNKCFTIKKVISQQYTNIINKGGKITVDTETDEKVHNILVKLCTYLHIVNMFTTKNTDTDNKVMLFKIYLLYGQIVNDKGDDIESIDYYDMNVCNISNVINKYFIHKNNFDKAHNKAYEQYLSQTPQLDKIRLYILDDYFIKKASCIGNSFSFKAGLDYDNKKSKKMYLHLDKYNIYDPNIRNKLAASVFGFKANWGYIGKKDVIEEKETFLSQVSKYKLDPLEYMLQDVDYIGISDNSIANSIANSVADSIKWFGKGYSLTDYSKVIALIPTFPLDIVIWIFMIIRNEINIVSDIYQNPSKAIAHILSIITSVSAISASIISYGIGLKAIIESIITLITSVTYILPIAYTTGIYVCIHSILYLLQINKHNPLDLRLNDILTDGLLEIPLSEKMNTLKPERIIEAINYNNNGTSEIILNKVLEFISNVATSSLSRTNSLPYGNVVNSTASHSSIIYTYENTGYSVDINKDLKHINISLKNLTDVQFNSSYDKKLGNELKMYNDNREKFLEQYHKKQH